MGDYTTSSVSRGDDIVGEVFSWDFKGPFASDFSFVRGNLYQAVRRRFPFLAVDVSERMVAVLFDGLSLNGDGLGCTRRLYCDAIISVYQEFSESDVLRDFQVMRDAWIDPVEICSGCSGAIWNASGGWVVLGCTHLYCITCAVERVIDDIDCVCGEEFLP